MAWSYTGLYGGFVQEQINNMKEAKTVNSFLLPYSTGCRAFFLAVHLNKSS